MNFKKSKKLSRTLTLSVLCASVFGGGAVLSSKAEATAVAAFNDQTIKLEGTADTGDYAVSIGADTVASGNYSAAFGLGATGKGATGDGSFVAGGVGAGGLGLVVDANTASGRNAVAMGEGNTASGNNSVAMGYQNTADGTSSVAMGSGAKAYGADSVALGRGQTGEVSTTGGSGAFAVGRSTATGNYSVALGDGNTASGGRSVALGDENASSGEDSVAIGCQNVASGENSVAMGLGNMASGNSSVAMGMCNAASGIGATAFGYGNLNEEGEGGTSTVGALGDGSFVVGGVSGEVDYGEPVPNPNTASGRNAVAMGEGNTASGIDSMAVGYESKAYGLGSVAFGQSTAGKDTTSATTDTYAFAAGKSTASGTYSVAMGNSNIASGNSSVAMGSESKAYGEGSVAFGTYTVAGPSTADADSETCAFAAGNYSIASGNYSVAMGNGAEATGGWSVAMGLNSKANGKSSVAMGQLSTANAEGSVAMGSRAQTGAKYGSDESGWNYVGGEGAVAMGFKAKAYAEGSVAFGGSTAGAISGDDEGKEEIQVISGRYSFAAGVSTAIGDYSVAMGNGAEAQLADSVALGSGSKVTSAAGASGVAGYLQPKDNTSATWVSTKNAIAVGYIDTATPANSVTRQIIGVAAGTADTDAVNVAQLKAATNGITTSIGTIDADKTYVKTSNTVSANLIALDSQVKTNTDKLKDLETAGLDATAVTNLKTYVTTSGLNADSKKIINVTAGTADTDAANLGQVKGYSTVSVAGTAVTNTGTGVNFAAGDNVSITTSGNTITISATGGGGGGESFFEKVGTSENIKMKTTGKITNVSEGELSSTSTDVVIGKQLFATNTQVTANKDAIALNKTDIGKIQQYVTDNGINANNKKITNVAAGENPYDAVNYAQYSDLANNMERRFSKVNEDIGRTGAASAALASLHPQMMRKGESQVMAGMGRYHGKSGAAVGLAWQPHKRVMLSGGFADAAGEIMFNVGASYKFGQHSYTAEQLAELNNGAGTPLYVAELNAALKSKDVQIMNLKSDNAAIKAELAELKAIVAQLVKAKK